jgi:monoamine oxidase
MGKIFPNKSKDTVSHYDLVICGAGISGLYCAWRLLSSEKWKKKFKGQSKPKIAILEQSNRIGGRIESVYLNPSMTIPSELGAMRFYKEHLLVNFLTKHFNLTTESFSHSYKKSFFLRGKRLEEEDFKHPNRIPYNLREEERGMLPDDLLEFALNKIISSFSNNQNTDYHSIKKGTCFKGKNIKNIELYKIGFCNALQDILSHEAFQLLKDSGGYDSNFMNWNTAEAVTYLLENFSKKLNPRYIVGGMSKLPEAIAEKIIKLGGEIHISTQMLGFEINKKNKVSILCKNTGSDTYCRQIESDQLILALPQRSLELLDQNNSLFQNNQIQKLIKSVQRQPALKLFLSYSTSWWEPKENSNSVIISDLPLRMSYYFSKNSADQKDRTSQKESMVMIYEDIDPDHYWQGLYSKDLDREKNFGAQIPPQKMLEAVQTHLQAIHNKDIIPKPISYLFRDWSNDPFGGGYHVWRPDFDATSVMNQIRKPDLNKPVYICGEAYSNTQSWIEGALKTAESIMQEYFDLDKIQEIPSDYNLINKPSFQNKKAVNE